MRGGNKRQCAIEPCSERERISSLAGFERVIENGGSDNESKVSHRLGMNCELSRNRACDHWIMSSQPMQLQSDRATGSNI